MEDAEQQPPGVAAGAPPPNAPGTVKLPAFWAEDPVSWFRLAEGQFALRNVVDPVARYYHVLASLSQDAVRLVRHVLHQETGPDSYANLRTSLLASHSLSNYQKMERMMKLPPLGDRKPSVMLAEMLEFCPAGESTTAVFTYLFLQRLPREIRVLLSEDDPADVRAIADKADCLIAMHVPQHHDACAAVAGGEDSDPGDIVKAAPEVRRKKFKLPTAQRPQQQKGQGRRQEPPRRPQGSQGGLKMSMCYYHAKYGERARYCEEGCLWPEN
jgi:hypothetical protein